MVNPSLGEEIGPVPVGPAGGPREDELLATLRRLLSDDAPGVRLGLGDDAALVDMGAHLGVLTADMLVEGVHFALATTSARDLGYKAVAVNVSDVAAMGGSPRYGLVSLGVPAAVDASWVVELYGGIRDAATEYAVSIVGGDTSRSDRVVLSVAVTGEVARGRAVTRAGARPADRIVVTGWLGGAAGGLALSRADPHVVAQAVGSGWGHELLGAHFRPAARVGEGQALAGGGATGMIDVSGGLTLDLWRLCRESGVGAAVRLADVPVHPALFELAGVLEVEPLELALSGGEDYELLATLPAPAVKDVASGLRDRFGTTLMEIGEIRAGEGLTAMDRDGNERPMEPKGWDHLAG